MQEPTEKQSLLFLLLQHNEYTQLCDTLICSPSNSMEVTKKAISLMNSVYSCSGSRNSDLRYMLEWIGYSDYIGGTMFILYETACSLAEENKSRCGHYHVNFKLAHKIPTRPSPTYSKWIGGKALSSRVRAHEWLLASATAKSTHWLVLHLWLHCGLHSRLHGRLLVPVLKSTTSSHTRLAEATPTHTRLVEATPTHA